MTDRPILFSAPMVRALLSGHKTQTRRVLKPPRGAAGRYTLCHPQPDTEVASVWWHDGDPDGGAARQLCPYGQPGDRLWVRETWSAPHVWEALGSPPKEISPDEPIWYWADGNPTDGDWMRPKPSIHMPRWASRLTLKITEVRVERLQDISSADAKAEGAEPIHLQPGGTEGDPSEGRISYVEGYRKLWESINGKGSWDANPWVWALTFEVEQ